MISLQTFPPGELGAPVKVNSGEPSISPIMSSFLSEVIPFEWPRQPEAL